MHNTYYLVEVDVPNKGSDFDLHATFQGAFENCCRFLDKNFKESHSNDELEEIKEELRSQDFTSIGECELKIHQMTLKD